MSGFFVLLLALATPKGPPLPYGAPEVRAWVGNAGHRSVTVQVSPFPGVVVPTHVVPFAAETWVLAVAKPPPVLAERNVLGLGLALDLDGDGRTTGRWPLKCEGEHWRIGDWAVPLVGRPARYPMPEPRLGEGGVTAWLHRPCSPEAVVVGFGAAGQPGRERLPGPLLQVGLVETIGPKQRPRLAMSGFSLNSKEIRPARTLEVRTFVADPEATWQLVQLALVPLPDATTHTLDFRVQGTGPGFIWAAMNTAPRPDEREIGPVTTFGLP